MNRYSSKHIILIFLMVTAFGLAFYSCKKDNTVDGPLLEQLLGGEFGIIDSLKINKSDIDFAAGDKVYFTAKFKKIVNWKIDIHQTGNHYYITGKSNEINSTNATWDGSTSVLPIFSPSQTYATLTVEGQSISMEVIFNILSVKLQNNTGTLINDFNGGFMQPTWRPKWVQAGATMDIFKKYTYLKGTDTITGYDVSSPFNDDFLAISGTVTWDWLIAYNEIPANALYKSNYYPNLINVASQVYFNTFVYSDTVNINKESRLEFWFYEDDNGDNKYTEGVDDKYTYNIPLNWIGWKSISIRYDSIPIVFTPPEGQTKNFGGNQISQPANILGVRIMLLANPKKGKAVCGVDQLVFTNFKPYKP